jgi:MFS family permease
MSDAARHGVPTAAAYRHRGSFIAGLGIGQIISWGSLYYSFPLIAGPMGRDLALSVPELYGAATVGLGVGSLATYPIGVVIDRGHGRVIMACGSALGGLLLVAWSQIASLWAFYCLFIGIGLAQAMTLYEPAMAIVARRYGAEARTGITALTLWGGFASTVFVPLVQLLLDHSGWRAALRALGLLNLVVGVNDHLYDPAQHRLLTAASCTTNCLAPVVKVLHKTIGIQHGQITTIHDPTNTNVVVDAPHKDLRRARSALLSLQPTTTGSATAIGLIYPELQGKLNGHAVRVPVLNAGLTDCVFEMTQPVTVDEVNSLFRYAAAGPLAGILGFEARPLVSADYVNDTRSAIVDGPSTMVTDETLLKVYAWYDNEVGYACRMVDLATIVMQRGV